MGYYVSTSTVGGTGRCTVGYYVSTVGGTQWVTMLAL